MIIKHTVKELKMKFNQEYRAEQVHEKNGFITGRYKLTKPRTFEKEFFPVQINKEKLYEVRVLLEENGLMEYCLWGK